MSLLDGTEDITELEKISPERVDGVGDPASGFPILMLKMTAPGAAEEAPPVTATATGAPEAEAEPEAAAPQQEAAKATAPDPGTVRVDLPADLSLSISPRDLARLATFKQELTLKEAAVKRDMDPDVGGGVDRDKLKPGDFVFPDERDFPVVIPGDVPDAVSSWGRYKGKRTFAQFKAALTALARRKGAKFVAELPKEWAGEDGAAKAKAVQCPGCNTFNKKGATECTGCHKPMPGKKGKPAPGAEDGTEKGDAEKAGPGKACKCGSAMAKDAKFCSQCGKPASGDDDGDSDEDDDTSDDDAAKSAASPQDAKVDDAISALESDAGAALAAQAADPDNETHPADQAVQAHLEDAADAIGEAAEAQQADEATDDPAAHGMAAKSAAGEAPYHLARLHDATCAAFRHDDVVLKHPAAARGVGHLADPAPFSAMVTAVLAEDAGTGSRAGELPAVSAAYQAAIAIKSLAAQDGLLDGAMEGMRKAFTDAYPDAHPVPGSITPGQFRRPYIGAGHASQAAGASQRPRIPLASHVPDPSDFRRPLLTAGHEAAAPGSAPSGVGKAGRTYYSNSGKQQAVDVLGAMHDYIAGQHPDLCPMAGATYDGEQAVPGSMGSSLTTATPAVGKLTPNRATSVPVPVGAGAQSAATTKAAGAAGKEPAMAPEAVLTQAPAIDRDLLKSVLSEVVTGQLGDITKALGDLSERVTAWESAPDVTQMAPRSGMAKAASTSAPEVPAGGDGREVERLVRLVKRAKDPDPQVRDEAMGELFKAVGREDAVVLLAS